MCWFRPEGWLPVTGVGRARLVSIYAPNRLFSNDSASIAGLVGVCVNDFLALGQLQDPLVGLD